MRKAGLPIRLRGPAIKESSEGCPYPVYSLLLCVNFLGKSQGTGRELHTVTTRSGLHPVPKDILSDLILSCYIIVSIKTF